TTTASHPQVPAPPSFCLAPPPPETSTLPLHDALPICITSMNELTCVPRLARRPDAASRRSSSARSDEIPSVPTAYRLSRAPAGRSEEHTSELQSRFELVCRRLLEKRNGRGRTSPPPSR